MQITLLLPGPSIGEEAADGAVSVLHGLHHTVDQVAVRRCQLSRLQLQTLEPEADRIQRIAHLMCDGAGCPPEARLFTMDG